MSREVTFLNEAPTFAGQPHAQMAARQGWIPCVNKTGSVIETGKQVIADVTEISVVAAAVVVDDAAMTLADTLATENGAFRLKFTNAVNAFLADSIVIVGKDLDNNTVTDTVVTETTAGANYLSNILFTEITSITPGTVLDTGSTLAVVAIAVNAFAKPAATANLLTLQGTAIATVDGGTADYDTDIADEATFFMATRGIVPALVDPVDQAEGTILGSSGTTAGNLAVTAVANAGKAKLLEENSAENVAGNKLYVNLLY